MQVTASWSILWPPDVRLAHMPPIEQPKPGIVIIMTSVNVK